jgi:hypothetical protein
LFYFPLFPPFYWNSYFHPSNATFHNCHSHFRTYFILINITTPHFILTAHEFYSFSSFSFSIYSHFKKFC